MERHVSLRCQQQASLVEGEIVVHRFRGNLSARLLRIYIIWSVTDAFRTLLYNKEWVRCVVYCKQGARQSVLLGAPPRSVVAPWAAVGMRGYALCCSGRL